MQTQDHDVLSEKTVEDISLMFKALADPTRIRILYMLTQEECSVNHIAEVLDLSQSAVSHQLSYLRTMRLVKHRRSGTAIIYSCNDNHVISLLKQAITHSEHT
ncbi:ArsR/SmtB family transcription factor [Paenibacillus silvisoli]|uniref:ArsR/SmtB family transcription factor n=1 Tax=Paenibacillus silvisoli TaxID=3110539 RepID=UPI002804B72F|nr:metalloregulator ArsR/SmtB family transcription factor [Paenibacillus silvisoli]